MPEEKQRKSIRTAELDKMINKLRSLDRVDGTSEYYKNNAIAYLSDLANHLDRIGVKTTACRRNRTYIYHYMKSVRKRWNLIKSMILKMKKPG